MLILPSGCTSTRYDTKAQSPTQSPVAKTENLPPLPPQTIAKVGELVSIEDRAIKVLGVQAMDSIPSGNPYVESPVAKGVFLVLVAEATNTGKETGNLAFSSFELTDAQGRTYTTDDSFSVARVADQFAKGAKNDDIPPGLTNRFPLVFDVTPDATGLILNWKGHQIDIEASVQGSEPQAADTAPKPPEVPTRVVSPPTPESRNQASTQRQKERIRSVKVDGVEVQIPDSPGFNAYVYDPPSNCRSSASKSARVVTVFQRGFINVDIRSATNEWYPETHKGCYIHKSQFKLIPAEYLPQ
jgi:hypothetical protein